MRVKGLTQPSIQRALLLHLFARQETEDIQPVLDHDDDEVTIGCVDEVLPVEDVLPGVPADAANVEPAAVNPDKDGFLWMRVGRFGLVVADFGCSEDAKNGGEYASATSKGGISLTSRTSSPPRTANQTLEAGRGVRSQSRCHST